MELSKILKKIIARLPITEQEHIKPYLKQFYEEKILFHRIISEFPYGILILDSDKKIKIFNKKIKPYLANQDNKIFKNEYEKLNEFLTDILKKKNYEITCQIEIDGEEPIYIKWQSIPVYIDKTIKNKLFDYLIVIINDITYEVKKEQKFLQSEKLALLGTLSAGIAHELRNPLSTIFIHLDILKRLVNDLQVENKSDFQEILEIITEEMNRLNQITNDFLKIAKPLKINLIKTNLKDLLEKVIKDFNMVLQQKNIKLDFFYEEIEDIYVDPKGIFQAIYNLLKNAIEAIEKNGKIIVRLYKENNFVCIDIIDNGKGIDEENLNKIFEPYFTTKKTGTGLGLMNVYNIIHSHKGKITVNSKKNVGTKFTIYLPMRLTPYQYIPLIEKKS